MRTATYRVATVTAAIVILGELLPAAKAADPAAKPTESSPQGATAPASRTAWFHEAKFGMFIHWGLYALAGKGEWVMHRQKTPVAEYAKLAEQFNPVKFNAQQWVRVAKDAGMKYIIITSKHHDGFAMFGSKASSFNIVDATPFRRDPLKELSEACRQAGIRLGFYYSHAQDWHHPGGAVARGPWDPAQKGDFDDYLRTVAIPQIRELLSGYGPVAVLWCDTPWNMDRPRAARIIDAVRATQPATLVNSRLVHHGREISGLDQSALAELREIGVDYLSYADRQIPAQPQWRDWETCMTLNQSWGYNASDHNWKTADELVRHLVEVASKGGNYLLNVGPTAEGVIPEPSLRILQQVGAWLAIHGEAIYGAGPTAFGYEFGKPAEPAPRRGDGAKPAKTAKAAAPLMEGALDWRCTTKPGKLYIHLLTWPAAQLTLDGVKTPVTRAYLLADSRRKALAYDFHAGRFSVSLPAANPGHGVAVLCLETPP